MSDWPRWSLEGEELALARYVLPDEVAALVELPGRSAESRLTRLRAVYQALASVRIGYAYEAPTDEAGRQVIRPPDQVLWAPRHATCLDLALTLAGGCLTAGLHPVVVVLAPPGAAGSLHALLLVGLDRDTEPGVGGAMWRSSPAGLLGELQRELDGPLRRWVAIDPVGLAVSLGTARTPGLDVDFADAVTNGGRYLTGGTGTAQWTWRVGVDVGSAWRAGDTQLLARRPTSEPLREPYRPADTAESPLRLLRAEYGLVPFHNRDELTILRDWCGQVATGNRTGLAVVTGLGGCGKTRLVLELAARQRSAGWYAGVLPKSADGIDWLASVVSPLLIVLDYADGRVLDAIALLKALRVRRGPPAVVLLTARSTEGDWLPMIENALVDDRHPYRIEPIALPDTHPDSLDVYHRTVTALTPVPVEPPTLPQGIRWTTLDFVLLGWIAAQGALTLPASHSALYEQALVHEMDYWCTAHGSEAPERALLRRAAACVSLVSPDEQQAYRVLAAVEELADDPTERRAVRRTLVTCVSPAAGEGLAVRPDPIGDHLLLTELGKDPTLLSRTLNIAGESNVGQAVFSLARAGQNDATEAAALITGLLVADIDRWRAVLSVALAQGGAAAASLGELTDRADTPLPLDELSEAIPFSSTGLYDLGLAVERRRLDAARAANAESNDLAEKLMQVSARAAHAGDRAAALASITEAVEHYRQLADANPAAFLPDLAGSLNDLSRRQADSGDRAAALASITEAVERCRQLAHTHPAVFLPGLATSLNNLSNEQSRSGDRAAALASITEAVEYDRQLARANPAIFLPHLAGSLNNLSVQQSDTGDRAAALASITEAVEYDRQLARANPAIFLPHLAGSLNNLSVQQSDTGDRAAALASITEAVEFYRQLADVNPAVFLPGLAMSLHTLSNQQSDTGDRAAALASITEAVEYYRQLAHAHPSVFLPNLAMSLNNLCVQQSDTGDRVGALASITQAVEYYRQLADVNRAVFLPGLAMSLNNLSNEQSETGDRAGALTSITEAVDIRRQLTHVNPSVFLPDLATSLNNLSNQQSHSGDRAAALASITEAVEYYRQLARANSAVFLPGLAMSLNTLSNQQSRSGDRAAALASITEAVEYYRQLSDANLFAFLPDLATSLHNLSVQQSDTRDRAAALASITEAVYIRRQLGHANPAAFLPDLALSLNILSPRQSDTGDWAAALASITEAVEYYRQLAAATPAAFLADLAGSLNNLSNQQSDTGDVAAALVSITEAVDIRRQLAHNDPAVFLPDLAMSLSNLSLRQGDTGDVAAALVSIAEAVKYYRQLADANPAAYLPDLAGSLNNLCLRQSDGGDRVGALVSITEAVDIRRQLAEANPAVFLPDLAMSLNNLCLRQSDGGDRVGALVSITEAVDIRRQLAEANPAVFLPKLAMSLNNLSDQMHDAETSHEALVAWQDAIDAMPYPAARAELRAAWARQLFVSGEQAESREQLRRAAVEADEPASATHQPDRAWLVVAMRARQAVRAQAVSHDGDFPAWANALLPDDHLAMVSAFGRAKNWPSAQTVLDQQRDLLLAPEFRRTLTALQGLYLDNPVPTQLAQLLNEIDSSGIDAVIAARRADHNRRVLLDEWIAAPTWTESFAFLRQHATALTTDDVRQLLASADSDLARQHLAILNLAATMPNERVEAVVTDSGAAEDAAFDAIEHGDLATLAATLQAAPQLQEREITHAVVVTVLLLAADQLDTARDVARQVADHATAVQRRAHAIRLSALRSQRPHLPGLDEITEIIRSEDAAASR